MSVFVIADTHLSLSTENKSMEVFGGRWNDYINKLEKNWNGNVTDSDSVVIAGDISWGMNIDLCAEDFRFINDRLNGEKYILKGNHDYWWTTMAKMNKWLDQNGFDRIKIIHNNAYLCENYIICGTRGWFIDEDGENGGNGENGEGKEICGNEMFNQKILNREINRLDMSVQAAKKIKLEFESGAKSAKNDKDKEFQECEIIACIHYPPVYGGYVCPEIIEVLQREEIKRCYFGHIHNAGENNKNKLKRIYGNIKFELISADFLKFKPLRL